MAELKMGLALSGGGFRATLFHIGSLHRLNEIGWLRQLDVITSVSGGSIISGVLARRWNELQWAPGRDGRDVATNLADVVEAPLREFCAKNVDLSAGLWGMVNPFRTIAEEVEAAYDEHLFHGARLADIPAETPAKTPRFVFYATSLQTGVSVRIGRKFLADYLVGVIDDPDLSLAKVVAASSAFPPVLSPVLFEFDPASWKKVDGAELYDDERYRRKLVLADGGVYDNIGLEAIAERCETVLVSDAGAPITREPEPDTGSTEQLARVRDILIEQTRALRKRHLIGEFEAGRRKGAYWGITTRIGDYGLADALASDTATSGDLCRIRTRLNRFTAEEQGRLINWGYVLADAAMRGRVLKGQDVARGQQPDDRYRV